MFLWRNLKPGLVADLLARLAAGAVIADAKPAAKADGKPPSKKKG